MPSFWRPTHDPRLRTLPAIPEQPEPRSPARSEQDATLPTAHNSDSEKNATPPAPLSRDERLARRLARQPDFRPQSENVAKTHEVQIRLAAATRGLAEFREGVDVLRAALARRRPQRSTPTSWTQQRMLTYDEVERFVQLASAEYRRRFGEPAGA